MEDFRLRSVCTPASPHFENYRAQLRVLQQARAAGGDETLVRADLCTLWANLTPQQQEYLTRTEYELCEPSALCRYRALVGKLREAREACSEAQEAEIEEEMWPLWEQLSPEDQRQIETFAHEAFPKVS